MRLIVEKYLLAFPHETALQQPITELTRKFSDRAIIDRAHFEGHLTASALVIHRAQAQVVLIKHPSLGRWLQPGGHIEPCDRSPLEAAIRELKEEVGIERERLRVIPPAGDEQVPMDIDTHPIPANARKNEPAHMHHDFRYLFVVDDARLTVDPREVDDCRWFSIFERAPRDAFPRLLDKACDALGLSAKP